MQKTNGEHILDIAAMKFFNHENWEIELAAMLPTGFKEVLIAEIDNRLSQLAVNTAINVSKNTQG